MYQASNGFFLRINPTSLLCLICYICFPVNSYSAVSNNQTTCNVLFIGNSITGMSMPQIVENMGAAAGKNIYVDANIIGGTSIVEICHRESTTQKLHEKQWDYIVIQGDIHNMAFPETHHIIMPWIPYESIPQLLQEMKETIAGINSNTKILFFMPWAYEDGMTWVAGQTDTYATMQVKIKDNAVKFGHDYQIVVAPVGWAWYQVYIERGVADLFMPDFVHPTSKGSYLAACVFYTTIFLESCEGISYYADLSQTESEYFQSVASSVVLDNLNLWDQTTTDYNSEKNETPSDFTLYQNFPNPFNPKTTISYSLSTFGFVSLEIFSVLGKEILTFVDKEQNPGIYKIEFDAAELPSGTYFYQLRHNGKSETKKMIILK
ncbi:MAG: hypothetical protein A2V66_18450 [Ignavibacteria bacterium RBG_13_36_8]|nr:MAG: hypothetical protein A2V66_18450 [Ignavibacteria bacterium RBG_13_36_8]